MTGSKNLTCGQIKLFKKIFFWSGTAQTSEKLLSLMGNIHKSKLFVKNNNN